MRQLPGTLAAPLGLGILGKTRENLGASLGLQSLESLLGRAWKKRTLGAPLGLEILGQARENIEILGTLAYPSSRSWKNPGTLGAPLGLENLESPKMLGKQP